MPQTIVIDGRFNGPRGSSNGDYACGRVAAFIDGPARVRLRVPPPLDVSMRVDAGADGVRVFHGDTLVAEGWPAPPIDADPPEPPGFEEARLASRSFAGLTDHRFSTCFVCGVDRERGDGLRLFAGPVAGRDLVACAWEPDPALADDGGAIPDVFAWCALDCPGGFAFPHPASGTILLGELRVEVRRTLSVSQRYVVTGWEVRREGRKHFTGTAIHDAHGHCCGLGLATWFEVDSVGPAG